MAALALLLVLCAGCVQGVRLDISALAQNPFSANCDPKMFMNFQPSSGGLFSGGLRKEAHRHCNQIYNGGFAPNVVESNLLKEVCKKGANMGQLLCSQQSDVMGEDGVAPLALINHWEIGGALTPARQFYEEASLWCKQKPAWTGFGDCMHACQYHYRDCDQWDTCKVCERSDTDCDGVRDKVYTSNSIEDPLYNYDVPPIYNYSFLRACVMGCRAYVSRKSKTDGGPACKSKKHPYNMFRTVIRQEFVNGCRNRKGTLDGQRCMCREAGHQCINPLGERSRPGMVAYMCMNDRVERISGWTDDCSGCHCG